MHRTGLLLALAFGISLLACSKTTTERFELPPLQAVPQVDLERYLGTWYELASYPQRFQEGCTGTSATYTLRSDGEIDVLNKCRKGALDGPEDIAEGRARIVDRTSNAKLEVTFFWPFYGDYWVIDLGPEYEYAVVGHPSREYLWILSRTPAMEDAVYQGILERLRAAGYDTGALQKTLQAESAPAS